MVIEYKDSFKMATANSIALYCNVSGKSDDVFPIQEQAEHTQYNPHTREKDHANAQVGRNLPRRKAAMRTPERETARTPSHAQVSHSVWQYYLTEELAFPFLLLGYRR